MCLTVSAIPVGIIAGIQGFRASLWLLTLIFGVILGVSFVISYFITRPLERLTKNIDAISKGKLDVNLNHGDIYEINNLTDSLNRVMASLKLAVHKVGVKKGEIFEDAVKTQEALEKKQRDLFNSIRGWAWETDANGVYTFCSDNVLDITGYKPDEIVGKNFFDFLPVEEVKKAKQVFDVAGKKKTSVKNFENCYISKNGEKKYVLTNAVPFYDDNGTLLGFRGVYTDITYEKEAKEKIRELKTELSNLKMRITELLNERDRRRLFKSEGKKKVDEKWSEHEFDSVFIFDENANIVDCNENMYKRLGYSKSEMLSLNMADFDALESKKDLLDKIKKAKKDGAVSFKTIHKRKDGSAVLVHENLQYIKDKNEFKAIVREDYSLKKPL
ncbi:MAG: hypothetical protein DRM98_01270 [Thermoplasmata archaeon]|nr:MAG: hypothetical protein DRM98_01270 [Thermoplasmata archaeon]RLF51227.1 MAG: hypothetical protein DRN24_05300 [Thermoplasmata archaeon]